MGGVIRFVVIALSTLEMTWKVGASYRFSRSVYFARSSLIVSCAHVSEAGSPLGHVQLGVNLLVLRPLGDQERVPRGALSNGRVQAEHELHVQVVHLGQEEDAVNVGEGHAVVGRFAQEAKRVVEEFERISSSTR